MDVLMPQLGETVAEGKISKWFVVAGDSVKPGDNLFEIETDKVSMEVPAIAAGTLSVIHVQAGEIVPVGAVVAQIVGAGESAATLPLTPAKAGVQKKEGLDARVRGNERSAGSAAPPKPIPMQPFREVRTPDRNYGPARLPGGTVVTPLARRLAGEAGIDLAAITGSGPHGRIVARDVQSASRGVQDASRSAWSTFKSPAPGPPEPAMPHLVLTADVAIGDALALCAETAGAHALSLIDVVAKAWAAALQRAIPEWPTDIEVAAGQNLIMLRNVAALSLSAITKERQRGGDPVGARAASSAVSIAEAPGIVSVADVPTSHKVKLALGSPRRAPVEAADGTVAFADMVTASLSCDHRAANRALAIELLAAFKSFVEKPVTMLV